MICMLLNEASFKDDIITDYYRYLSINQTPLFCLLQELHNKLQAKLDQLQEK